MLQVSTEVYSKSLQEKKKATFILNKEKDIFFLK